MMVAIRHWTGIRFVNRAPTSSGKEVKLRVGKMFKIGPMPVMLMAEYQYALVAPDDIGKVFKTSLSRDDEETLRAALEKA